RDLRVDRVADLQAILHVQEDGVPYELPCLLLLGLAFRVAPRQRRTNREEPSVLVSLDHDRELEFLHLPLLYPASPAAPPVKNRTHRSAVDPSDRPWGDQPTSKDSFPRPSGLAAEA